MDINYHFIIFTSEANVGSCEFYFYCCFSVVLISRQKLKLKTKKKCYIKGEKITLKNRTIYKRKKLDNYVW